MAMQPCYNHHHIYTYIVTTTNATYVQPSAHTHTYGDVYTHTHICTHRNTCIHINTLTRADLWTHVRTYTCPRTQTLPTHTCTPSLPMATHMYATNTQVLTTQKHTRQVSTNIHNMQGWSHTHTLQLVTLAQVCSDSRMVSCLPMGHSSITGQFL